MIGSMLAAAILGRWCWRRAVRRPAIPAAPDPLGVLLWSAYAVQEALTFGLAAAVLPGLCAIFCAWVPASVRRRQVAVRHPSGWATTWERVTDPFHRE